jgi:hypothetical protein
MSLFETSIEGIYINDKMYDQFVELIKKSKSQKALEKSDDHNHTITNPLDPHYDPEFVEPSEACPLVRSFRGLNINKNDFEYIVIEKKNGYALIDALGSGMSTWYLCSYEKELYLLYISYNQESYTLIKTTLQSIVSWLKNNSSSIIVYNDDKILFQTFDQVYPNFNEE